MNEGNKGEGDKRATRRLAPKPEGIQAEFKGAWSRMKKQKSRATPPACESAQTL